jgi:hypothetical protein
MYYILEIDNIIFNIFTNYDSGIIQLYKLSNICNKNCNLKEFINGAIIGIYTVNNNNILYTSNKNGEIITEKIKNLPFELLNNSLPIQSNLNEENKQKLNEQSKQNLNKTYRKNLSSDINVQLPPINTEIAITTENDEEIDIDELKNKIEMLNRLREEEIENLENLNENLHEYENKVIDEKFSVDAEKNKLKRDKEKWEEFKNIFNADKKIYKIMKEQFDKNEISEIPELFEKKYPIFSVLDDNNLLDTSSEIYEYIKLLPDDDSVYIPKDIVLTGLFNDNNVVSSISLTELKAANFETTIETDDET